MWKFEAVETYKSVLEEMTDEQSKILQQFKESLDVELGPRHTDELLFKFLRAKNFNLKATKKIFLENYYNRIICGLNTILDTYKKPEVAEKFESTSVLGFARDGTLVRYMAAGRLDFYGFIMSMPCFDLCLYFSHIMEQDMKTLEEENLKTGKNVTEVTYVIDLEEFSLQQVLHKNVIEMGLDCTKLIQDCYPEIWRNVLVVNAPKIFKTVFSIFKPVLRPAVRDRIQIIDKASTKYTLLRYIDEDVLPSFLGGHRVDSKGDGLCREFIGFGGKVPEKFYSQNHGTPLSLDDPEVKVVTIGARSMFNLSLPVKEPGSELRFQARSEGGSISVSFLYKEFDPDPDNTEMPGEFEYLDENSENFKYKQISVEFRDQMNCSQEEGTVTLPWPGLYIARFSNASNWFTPRKLYHKYIVTPPKPQSSS